MEIGYVTDSITAIYSMDLKLYQNRLPQDGDKERLRHRLHKNAIYKNESLLKQAPSQPEGNNRFRHYHLYKRLEALLKTVSPP